VRFAAALLAIFFIAAAPVAPGGVATRSASLDELLAKVRKASGEPYRYHIVSHAREQAEGRAVDVTSDDEGLRYSIRHCQGTLCSRIYFDGERVYETGLNDSPVPQGWETESWILTMQTIESYGFADPAFRRNGGRIVERLPSVTLDNGRTARRIVVTPPKGVPMEVAIDESTSLLAAADKRDGRFQFTFHQYRDVDGKVTIPFEIDLNDTVFRRFEEREIVSEPLGAPAGLVPRIEGPAVMVKLLRSAPFGDVPILECTIGGQTVPCLLDTGNSGMSMSLELAEKLGIEPVGSAFGITGVGSYVTGVAKGPPLSIGSGVTYPGAYYVLLHDIHQFGFDLVLGTDVFAKTRLTIDYPKREVTFAPVSSDAIEHPLALKFERVVPLVSVGLSAEPVPLPMLLDTGDQSTINLPYRYYEAHPVLFKTAPKVEVAGVGGSSEQVIGEIPSVTLGDFILTRQRIGATKKPFIPGQSGHVGSGLLSHFRVEFDYAHGRVGLTPREGDAAVQLKP
jgi:hypothetical protein